MKKGIFTFAFIAFLLTSSVQAQTIKVEAMEEFSTANPASSFSVKITAPEVLPDGTTLEQGSIISGHVTNVQHAKRLKRDGYFEFIPSSITIDGKTKRIENPTMLAIVTDYEPLDPKEIAATVVKSAAGYAIKGATQGISLIQGMVQSENGNRLKSGVTQVYEDSPLSYIDEGSELIISPGDTVIMIINNIENGY